MEKTVFCIAYNHKNRKSKSDVVKLIVYAMWLSYETLLPQGVADAKSSQTEHRQAQKSPLRIIKIPRNNIKLKKHFKCKQLGAEGSFGKSVIYNTSVPSFP